MNLSITITFSPFDDSYKFPPIGTQVLLICNWADNGELEYEKGKITEDEGIDIMWTILYRKDSDTILQISPLPSLQSP